MAERGVDRRELSLSFVPTENSESGEKSRVLASAAVVSPACSARAFGRFCSCLPIP